MKKSVLSKEILSDRQINGWMGVIFGVVTVGLGATTLILGGRLTGTFLLIVFGVLCFYSGIEILRGMPRGWLLAFCLSLAFTVFIVCWNWDGAASLAKGIMPFLFAWGFYVGYLENRTLGPASRPAR